ncbi:HTH-type transcriptional activator RhaS [Sulfurospirillum diekertiae]|uniref:HTH-type transcriptional activator RhaS n=1 Tax=Sulfurospirillum diekertiae TaxID=1854492 RepID=A0A290HF96_9BACT|nr:AraC family transcriptional regulator [Sulfurospirillum diekertiae]ATB70193.1 HTH-type transcriptional activator RhaS [Sulfurospirillum diekertiae]
MDALFEAYRAELIKRIEAKREEDGAIKTVIPSLSFYRSSSTTEFATVIYEPSLCLVLQGSKALILGDENYSYDPSRYLLASVHMPTRVRIMEASNEKPYISLKLTFTMEDIFEVMKEALNKSLTPNPTPELGLCFGDMSTQVIDPITRLVRLLDTPNNIKFMAPMIIKEILYHVINDKGGNFLRKYLMDGSIVQQIVKVISKIKQDFAENINMKELAKAYGMSESSLYHNFKKVTMLSPLQFQKTLRLEEARRILLTQDLEATEVAFAVGYESPSQFSREYARMFGLPPKTYAKTIHEDTEDIA